MNAQFHHEFVTLVPLFYAGELTEEEWGLLQVHLAYCDSCRQAFEQYQHVAADVIPAMAASAAEDLKDLPEQTDRSLVVAEERLMQRLEIPTVQQKPRAPVPWNGILVGAAAACLVGGALYATVFYLHASHGPPPIATTQTTLKQPLSAPAQVQADTTNQTGRAVPDATSARLREQLSESEKKLAQADGAVADVQRQLAQEQAQQQQLTAQRDSLNQQLIEAQADSQSLREKLSAEQTETNQQMQQTAALQEKVRDLNAAVEDANTTLENKDRMLALDKDFLAHDRDIRDLMGARNLYIADIFDTRSNGSTAKPFGRIFYTRDRSLVFYGFDLDKQPGLKEASAFQAWGTGSGQHPVSLGLFYQDGNQRWVLRCNDATTLSRLNMVFVTVEPPGGSNKPTGKQLLRAYLQIQPNHP